MSHEYRVGAMISEAGIIGPAADLLRGHWPVCTDCMTCVPALVEVLRLAARDVGDFFNGASEDGIAVLLGLTCVAAGVQPVVSNRFRVRQGKFCSAAVPPAEIFLGAIAAITKHIPRNESGWSIELGIDRPQDGRHYMLQLQTSAGEKICLPPSVLKDADFAHRVCYPGAFRQLAIAVMRLRAGQAQPIAFPMLDREGLRVEGSLRDWADLVNAYFAILSVDIPKPCLADTIRLSARQSAA